MPFAEMGGTMPEGKDFRQQTEDGLVACAKWLERNAKELSETFSGGCRRWSVEFAFDCDGPMRVPEINVAVNKVDKDVIEAYTRPE